MPEHRRGRYSRFVRISKRFVAGSAGLLGAASLGMLGVVVYGLRAELARTRTELARVRAEVRDRDDELARLEDQVRAVDRGLGDVRRFEADARDRLLREIEIRTGSQTEARRRELAALEERLRALREATEAHERMLAASRADDDLELRYQELMSPTVRINARHEVGSGTIVWSKKVGRNVRTYVLTAWHIVQEDPSSEGTQPPLEVDFYANGKLVRTEPGRTVAREEALDLALVEVRGYHVYEHQARLATRRDLEDLRIFSKVYAIGCPLGYSPLPTSGELASKEKELDGNHYWMVNAPTIFGNSGGGIYDARSRKLIGVLSRISAYKNMIDVAVPHMGLVTSLDVVYDWLGGTRYRFILRDRLLAEAGALPASASKPTAAAGR
ncbi:MAG: hypothetical protein D6731_19270 [Planctomycetota bacterium]|nr:MAG: hypothetical protein D6731_19270 [Planctomycetota bacterium]